MNADEHQQLGGRYGVKGFPIIKIFGANKNKPTDYQGVYIPPFLSPLLNISHRISLILHLVDTSFQNFCESTGVF